MLHHICTLDEDDIHNKHIPVISMKPSVLEVKVH